MNKKISLRSLLRDDIQELIPYKPVLYPDVIKLDANENPFDFPDSIWQTITELLDPQSFTRYPDALAQDLISELSNIHGLTTNHIMVGNGSDELILNLMLTYGARNRVVIAVPTFSMYGIHARVAGANILEIPRNSDFDLAVDEILQAGKDASLVMLCSPNNPTGNSITTEQLEMILENSPGLVVVDQAYVEFGGTNFMPLVEKYSNLVILRTFSKAYGLAGLRVGYLFAQPDVINYLFKVKQPFNLNTFSQVAALAVLRHRDIFQKQVAKLVTERDKLYSEMQKISGVRVYPSDANYLMFSTNYLAKEVYNGLLSNNVLVRNFGEPELSRYLRVSVGQFEENQLFLQALEKVINTMGEKD